MSVTSPFTEARLALNALVNAEFAPEGYTVLNDKLHESLGNNGTRLGSSPIRGRPLSRQMQVMDQSIFFQFYGKWNEEIDPTTKVDPAKVEQYAERFMRAVQAAPQPGSDRVWYFLVTDLNFPDDPTGNKSRFEATLTVYGNNSSVVETTG